MMKIVNCDQEIIDNIPKIMELLYNIFGEEDIELFATLDETKKLGFIGRVRQNCVFINYKGEYTLFTLDEENKLLSVRENGYNVCFGEKTYLVDDNGVEHLVDIGPYPEIDEEGYDGCVIYKQYNPNSDVMCELRFQHNIRHVGDVIPIYYYHLKEIDTVYIDEKYNATPGYRAGLLPRRAKYFSKVAYEEGSIGYDLMAINDYGLLAFLLKGSYQLHREERPVRYVKSRYITREGNYGDTWPFAKQYTIDDIEALLKEYGFNKEIPSFMLDIHNQNDSTIKMIAGLVDEMNRVNGLLDKPENSNMRLTLKISE